MSASALAAAFVAGQASTAKPEKVPSITPVAVGRGAEVFESAQVDAIAEPMDTSARTADADAEARQQDLARASIIVMAPALALEFERNEVAANDKYADRKITITGSVYAIDDADQFGNPPIAWLQTDAYSAKVGAIISRDQAATLQKYRGVTLDCLGAQKRFRVIAKECVIHAPGRLSALAAE